MTANDLQTALGRSEDVKQLIAAADTNGDGQLQILLLPPPPPASPLLAFIALLTSTWMICIRNGAPLPTSLLFF